MAVNLTSTTRFADFTGRTITAPQSTQLGLIIDAVSEQIAQFCGRRFERQEYQLWLDGTGTNEILIPHFPITRVFQVAVNRESVGDVTFDDAQGTAATLDFDSTGFHFFSLNNSGVRVVNNIATTSIRTLADFETTAEAITGWSVRIDSGSGTRATETLRPFAGSFALRAQQIELVVPDEGVEGHLDDRSNRVLRRKDGLFPRGRDNIFVWFEAGFDLPSGSSIGTLPQGLEMEAIAAINQTLRNANTNTALKSERLADHAKVYSGDALVSVVASRARALSAYVQKSV